GQRVAVAGGGPGTPDQIAVLDGRTGNVLVPPTEVLIGDTGGVRVAAQAHGQVCQIYLGTGPGDPAVVEAMELDLSSRPSLRSLWVGTVFGGSTDGVTVAAGDVLGDGGTKVVVGSGPGETAKVTILKGASGDVLLAPTTVFGAAYTGGVGGGRRGGGGAVKGAGREAGVVGGGRDGPHGMAGGGTIGGGSLALPPVPRFGLAAWGEVSVAAGDLNGDGTPDVVIGSGPGVPPKV